jgi:hypothetical protein
LPNCAPNSSPASAWVRWAPRAAPTATLIDSFLRNGQAQLYRMQDWKHLIDYQDKVLGQEQNLLDYPDAGA